MGKIWNSTLRRITPLRARGRRGRRRWKRVEAGILYGPYHRWIGLQPCVLQHKHACLGPVVGHHLHPSRGEDVANEVPVCCTAHMLIHSKGPSRFEEMWGVDLESVAEMYARWWTSE